MLADPGADPGPKDLGLDNPGGSDFIDSEYWEDRAGGAPAVAESNRHCLRGDMC